MKKKLSITINEEKIKELEKLLEDGRFRNKSHVIEYSLDNSFTITTYSKQYVIPSM